MNYIRGIGFALFFGTIGFFAPILIGLSFTVCRWWVYGFNDFDRAYDLQLLPTYLASPAVGIAIIFATAGWATYAPKGIYRFTRTLIIIAALSLTSWVVLAHVIESLGLSPRGHIGRHQRLVEPLSVLCFAVPPVAMALILSKMRARRSSRAHG